MLWLVGVRGPRPTCELGRGGGGAAVVCGADGRWSAVGCYRVFGRRLAVGLRRRGGRGFVSRCSGRESRLAMQGKGLVGSFG